MNQLLLKKEHDLYSDVIKLSKERLFNDDFLF